MVYKETDQTNLQKGGAWNVCERNPSGGSLFSWAARSYVLFPTEHSFDCGWNQRIFEGHQLCEIYFQNRLGRKKITGIQRSAWTRFQWLTLTENDASTIQIIRRKFHFYCVPRNNSDIMLSHLAAEMCEDYVSSVLQFDAEHCVWESFLYNAFDFNSFVLVCHKFLQNRSPF